MDLEPASGGASCFVILSPFSFSNPFKPSKIINFQEKKSTQQAQVEVKIMSKIKTRKWPEQFVAHFLVPGHR